jgi:hypothetical protein
MDVIEIVCECVDRMQLTQVRVNWQTSVITVTNFCVALKVTV